jgi:hypothetical protein
LTSIFTAPGRVPLSGSTDWAIQSCGSSKLTVLAGSVKTFHAAAVAPAVAVAPADAPAEVLADPEAAPLAGLVPGSAVQTGEPLPSLLQPAISPAANSTTAAIPLRPEAVIPVMAPA